MILHWKRGDVQTETPRRETLQHALELEADTQQRTFQALLKMTLNESRGDRSHGKVSVM